MSDQQSDNTGTPAPGAAAGEAWTDAPEQKSAVPATAQANAAPRRVDEPWERDLIARVAFAAISEQRRARRWGIFFKTMVLGYFGLILFLSLPRSEDGLGIGRDHTALVELDGVIADNERANADVIVAGLRAAFKDDHAKAVILRVNSPGGSPVQAGYVNDEIKRLRSKYPEKKLYAVIVDICASGGYYIAAAADAIYADKASLVGSIGVLMDGFGFVGTMEKLGVERRLLTAGEHKGFLDPFSALKDSDAAHMRTILESTHKQFIDVVKSGRGDRLKDSPELFSGFIWNGEQALEMGLVDGLGSTGYVAREVIGEEHIVNYTQRPSPFERFAERIGAAMGNAAVTALGLTSSGLK
jgi:protease-4